MGSQRDTTEHTRIWSNVHIILPIYHRVKNVVNKGDCRRKSLFRFRSNESAKNFPKLTTHFDNARMKAEEGAAPSSLCKRSQVSGMALRVCPRARQRILSDTGW